jgi:Tfp pilus assembly protein PilO
MPSQTFLSSPLSPELAANIQQHLATIRDAPTDKQSRRLFADLISAMTAESMAFYFHQPMDIIQAGAITRKFVSIGVSGSIKMVSTMGKKAVSSLSAEQMLQLCDFLQSLIHEE